MEYYYRTANSIEDVDVQEEIESFESVMCIYANHEIHHIYDEEYHDVDFVISVDSKKDIEEISEMLNYTGYYSAYFEVNEKEMIKHK